MTLSAEERRRLRRLLANRDIGFAALADMAGLDRRFDFIRADLRSVDFGTSDLSFFNFAEADLRGADMTDARGKETLTLVGARTDGARGLPRTRVRRDADDLPEMVEIPPGSFMMGITQAETKREGGNEWDDHSRPRHRVTIANPFWLGRYPVTRGQYAVFVAATGHETPDKAWTNEPHDTGKWSGADRDGRIWRFPGFEQTDRDPVVCVSHTDAMAYVQWINTRIKAGTIPYRLPSEAEWEYAARAGTKTARFWGDGRGLACRYANVADRTLAAAENETFDADDYFDGEDGFAFTSPVGSFPPNPFGLCDMLGNVLEWVADPWHDSYQGAPSDGSAWITGGSDASGVLRGGSWNFNPRDVRADFRFHIVVGYRSDTLGFRLARTSF